MTAEYRYETVIVEKTDGIAWVTLNRPEKRNAMSPQLNHEMCDVLARLETDNEARVLVLCGAGKAWCAGMDLELFFRDLDDKPAERAVAIFETNEWRWNRLFTFPKPTIAMVQGYAFGGAFTQLIACDFAFAAEDATFGLSEVNWGIIPAGIVGKALMDALSYRDALYLALTGKPFSAKEAERMRLINKAVPADQLKAETLDLCKTLLALNPEALRGTKQALKNVKGMGNDQALDYLSAKFAESKFRDREGGYAKGIGQFVDDKSYRPGFGAYRRS
jgi:trans-feruloyl-CoA hydratase/vanillin synthase